MSRPSSGDQIGEHKQAQGILCLPTMRGYLMQYMYLIKSETKSASQPPLRK